METTRNKKQDFFEFLLLFSFILIMFGTFGFGADGKHFDKTVLIGMCMTGIGYLILITVMVIGFIKNNKKEI